MSRSPGYEPVARADARSCQRDVPMVDVLVFAATSDSDRFQRQFPQLGIQTLARQQRASHRGELRQQRRSVGQNLHYVNRLSAGYAELLQEQRAVLGGNVLGIQIGQ